MDFYLLIRRIKVKIILLINNYCGINIYGEFNYVNECAINFLVFTFWHSVKSSLSTVQPNSIDKYNTNNDLIKS